MRYLSLIIILWSSFTCFSKDIVSSSDSTKRTDFALLGEKVTDGGLNIKNHPNPFSDRTSIVYCVPENGFVEVKVLNATGKSVRTLVSENKTIGEYAINYEPGNLLSGIYFMQLAVNGKVILKKMNIRK